MIADIGFSIAVLRFAIEKPLKIGLITIQEPKNIFLNSIVHIVRSLHLQSILGTLSTNVPL